MSWAYTRSQRMRPTTWAREITTATQGVLQSKLIPRIMVPPYRLNPDADLNQGLVAKYICLPGMTGGRLWYDLCGKNNGTLTNMTSGYGWQGPQGRSGGWGAMRFDGTNDYVRASNMGMLTDKGTIAFWMNSSEIANYRNPLSLSPTGNNTIRFEEDSTGKFYAAVGNASTVAAFYYLSSGLVINTWYFVVLAWNVSDNTVVGYLGVNNSLTTKFTSANTLWPTITQQLTIGMGFTSLAARHWFGYTDDVSIYDRPLSSTEVAGLYEASKNQYRDEILCAYVT